MVIRLIIPESTTTIVNVFLVLPLATTPRQQNKIRNSELSEEIRIESTYSPGSYSRSDFPRSRRQQNRSSPLQQEHRPFTSTISVISMLEFRTQKRPRRTLQEPAEVACARTEFAVRQCRP